jgi:hypothetical protein
MEELAAFAAGLARRFGRPGGDAGISSSDLDATVEQEIDSAEG